MKIRTASKSVSKNWHSRKRPS